MFNITQRRKRYDKQLKISVAKVVLSGELTVRGLSEELQIKDSALRRWACEYEEMDDDAFPGNRSPKVNKDCEIVKLRKKFEELEHENEILKNFRVFMNQDHVLGLNSSRRIGAISVPSGRHVS